MAKMTWFGTSCATQWRGFDTTSTSVNHSDPPRTLSCPCLWGGGKWTVNRSLPSHDQRPTKTLASPPAKITITPHLLTRIWGGPKVVPNVTARLSSDLVWRKWAGWSGLVSCKEDCTWTFPTALSGCKNTKGSGLFHLHVLSERSQGQLKEDIPTTLSSGRAKPKPAPLDTPGKYLPHWWVHLGAN